MKSLTTALFVLLFLLPAAGRWIGPAQGAAAPSPPFQSLSTASAPAGRSKPKPAPMPAPPASDHFAAIHANSAGQPWKM